MGQTFLPVDDRLLVIRVLHIIPGKLYGGVESAMVTLARFREACPQMVTEAAVCWRGRLSAELEEAGIAVHVLGGVRARNPLSIWRARRRLHDLLLRRPFDAVVCHMPWIHAIFGPVVSSRAEMLVFRAHGAANPRHWVERWARMTRPDLILAVSRFVASDVEKQFPDVPVQVVYNPVPPARPSTAEGRRAVRAELNTSPDAIVIAQAGRMQPGKGHPVLLDALAGLRELNWKCWQIGGPQTALEREYCGELQRRALRLGIADRIRFLGQRSDVPRLLAAADIYCQANDTFLEGMGLTFVEAMGAGLPVVTTAIGAAPELVDETCAAIVRPGDVGCLTATLEKLMTNSALRTDMAAAGRRRACGIGAPQTEIRRLFSKLQTELQNKRPLFGTLVTID